MLTRPQPPTRRASARSPTARPARRHARRHDRLRDPAARRRASTASQADLVRRRRASVHAICCSGRVDAVLLDNVLAERRMRQRDRLHRSSRRRVAVGHYVGVLAPANARAARSRSTRSCARAMRDGTLERIFRKWSVWNDDQPALYARLLAGARAGRPSRSGRSPTPSPASATHVAAGRRRGATCPSLLRASVVTIVLSCLSMALAVALGMLHRERTRLRRARRCALALTGYVELMRGTPILLQLFVLYYGIAAAIRLPAFVAALLGPRRSTTPRTKARSTAARSRRSRSVSSRRRGRWASPSGRC